MADIVYSMLFHPPDVPRERFEQMVEMTRLWAAHLRGPGEHDGPVLLISDQTDLQIDGAERIPAEPTRRVGRRIMTLKVLSAVRHLRPGPDDRLMQIDTDALVRHPLRPLLANVQPGTMWAAPSGLALSHWQQVGNLLGRWQRRWYAYVRGWRRRRGVSASISACHGRDWPAFMERWAAKIREGEQRDLPRPLPGDQAYLNYLYAFGEVPIRRFGPDDVHHLRTNDPAPRDQIDRATILHFPGEDKLQRMHAWSRLAAPREVMAS